MQIPSTVFTQYYEACDLFIDNDHIGKSCTLYYPPKRVECANCTISHFGGISTNVYRHGGPAPFYGGKCSLCGGNGFSEEEVTTTIRLRIYWNKRDWNKVNNIQIPEADVMVIGYSADVVNFQRASYIILVAGQDFIRQKFELACEPFLHGFGKSRYFIGFLKRI